MKFAVVINQTSDAEQVRFKNYADHSTELTDALGRIQECLLLFPEQVFSVEILMGAELQSIPEDEQLELDFSENS